MQRVVRGHVGVGSEVAVRDDQEAVDARDIVRIETGNRRVLLGVEPTRTADSDGPSRKTTGVAPAAVHGVEDLDAGQGRLAGREHGERLHDEALRDLTVRAAEAVVTHQGGLVLSRLEHTADARTSGEVDVVADSASAASARHDVDHGADPGGEAGVQEGKRHQDGTLVDVGQGATEGARDPAGSALLEPLLARPRQGVPLEEQVDLVVGRLPEGAFHEDVLSTKEHQHGLPNPLAIVRLEAVELTRESGAVLDEETSGAQDRVASLGIGLVVLLPELGDLGFDAGGLDDPLTPIEVESLEQPVLHDLLLLGPIVIEQGRHHGNDVLVVSGGPQDLVGTEDAGSVVEVWLSVVVGDPGEALLEHVEVLLGQHHPGRLRTNLAGNVADVCEAALVFTGAVDVGPLDPDDVAVHDDPLAPCVSKGRGSGVGVDDLLELIRDLQGTAHDCLLSLSRELVTWMVAICVNSTPKPLKILGRSLHS